MNVANGLKIGWFKSDKWHLSKNMRSLVWFVCGFRFDPSLHVAIVRPKKKGFLGSVRLVLEQAVPFPRKLNQV